MTKNLASPSAGAAGNSGFSSSPPTAQTTDENEQPEGGDQQQEFHQQQQQQQQFQMQQPQQTTTTASASSMFGPYDGQSIKQETTETQPDLHQQQQQQQHYQDSAATMAGGFHRQQQPPPNGTLMPMCAQCRQPITDPYILRVHPDLEFHQLCLKCAECGCPLDEHGSAFVRDEKILCRNDYFRLYSRRCQRCAMQFQPSDLVMRARQLVFHRDCFNCVACHRMLMPGQQFLLRQDELFCQPECFMQIFQPPSAMPLPPPPPSSNSANFGPPQPPPQFLNLQSTMMQPFPPPPTQPEKPQPLTLLEGNGPDCNNAGGGGGCQQSQQENGTNPNGNCGGNVNNFIHSSSAFVRTQQPQQQQQSCCPSSAVSSGASPLSFSNDSATPSSTNASTPSGIVHQMVGASSSSIGGGQNATIGHFGAFQAAGMFDANGQPMAAFSSSGGGPGNSQGTGSNCSSSSGGSLIGPKHAVKKSKKDKPAQRVRTVLNESQLKILKQTYNQNQRPDTVTKEHLVEMTGLNHRVIRVWFQNKRCKDKKRQIEQQEKLHNHEKEQAFRSVRVNGIGPMTASSPRPILVDPNNVGHFGNSVEIRQLQQNPALWADGLQMGMDGGNGPMGQIESAFQHPLGAALGLMPNGGGIPPDFLHHHPNPGAMLQQMPMFPHAISE